MTMNSLQLRGYPSWERGVWTAAAHAQRDWRSSGPQSPVNCWADVEMKSADAAEPPTDVMRGTDRAVRLVRPAHDIRIRAATHALPHITLGHPESTSATAWSASCPLFAVCLPISGQIQITTNAATARVAGRSGAVVSPGCPVAVEYLTDDCRMQTLLFEQSALESELSTMIGQPASKPVQFDFELALTAPPSPFERALALLENEIAESAGLVAMPAMSTRLARLVIAGLLLSQPNNYTGELTRPCALPGSRAIRRALEFIEGRPSEIETVADIANEVGLSVRALDDGFRRYVGTPPMSYLRQVKMSRAHDALVSADPELTTATTIARRWGFGHYGRFASEYRRRYGRKPSETLRAR
jgi:AraC-like DNA-binding protein